MRILVADDSGVSRHVICSFLRAAGHDVITAESGTEALEALRSDTGISLALVDWMMPGLDGIEVCRQLRAIPDRAYTYMISVTTRRETQDIVCALEAGFDDFLTKPVQPAELNARLLVGSRIIDLQEKLIQTCKLSQFKAAHDWLTGLWNRGAILEFLSAQLAMAARHSNNLALIMVDVDHFKKINDTFGHVVGDSVLIHVARLMSASIRASDWLGRYGGEEFMVIASEAPGNNAVQVAERLRLAVADNPFISGKLTIPATISIGIANTLSIESPTPEALVRIADSALYRAKENGRNRIEVDPDYIQASLKSERCEGPSLNSVTH
jgi:two-component system chemotaxis response regulator CheY